MGRRSLPETQCGLSAGIRYGRQLLPIKGKSASDRSDRQLPGSETCNHLRKVASATCCKINEFDRRLMDEAI
jgi:hypothetical protein